MWGTFNEIKRKKTVPICHVTKFDRVDLYQHCIRTKGKAR